MDVWIYIILREFCKLFCRVLEIDVDWGGYCLIYELFERRCIEVDVVCVDYVEL